MKINDTVKGPVNLGTDKLESNTSKKADKAVETSESKSSGNSDVTLSPLSAQLKSLEAKVAADNVFDVDKVDAIKSAISSGQFKVDSEKVADNLINTVKDLLTTTK